MEPPWARGTHSATKGNRFRRQVRPRRRTGAPYCRLSLFDLLMSHPLNSRLSAAALLSAAVLCLVAIGLAPAFAQDAAADWLPAAPPETVGLSSERLERISAEVQRTIDQKRIAGAVTLVVRHGKVAWFKAQGMQDREAAKPMQTDSIFRICSMSKAIT